MLINTTIGLRYETENDQLRHVLVKFREMLHAHPKIHLDTVRVRFAGFGQSSLDIGVRIYALTRDFNEFHAIREDVFLRMSEIVKASGSSFAYPSQTLYMGRCRQSFWRPGPLHWQSQRLAGTDLNYQQGAGEHHRSNDSR